MAYASLRKTRIDDLIRRWDGVKPVRVVTGNIREID